MRLKDRLKNNFRDYNKREKYNLSMLEIELEDYNNTNLYNKLYSKLLDLQCSRNIIYTGDRKNVQEMQEFIDAHTNK